MMEGFSQHFRTEFFPIGAAVEQVKVPGFIHGVGRRNRMPSNHGQQCKALVFVHDANSVAQVPAVLLSEALRKRARCLRVIEFEGFNPSPQSLLLRCECAHHEISSPRLKQDAHPFEVCSGKCGLKSLTPIKTGIPSKSYAILKRRSRAHS